MGQKNTDELSAELAFGKTMYSFALTPTLSNTLMLSREACCNNGDNRKQICDNSMGKGHYETCLHDFANTTNYINCIVDALKDFAIYHFNDTGNTAKVKQVCNIDDNAKLRTDASNLSAFLYLLQNKHKGHYRNIVDTVKATAPFFEDFILRPKADNTSLIQLEWKQRGTDAYFNAHSFSDGTLRFICLVTLLSQPKLPSIILLDEPELGLHPHAITLLTGLLKSVAVKTQVVISTQSVTLVNQFNPGDIVVVENNNGASDFKRLKQKDTKNWIDEYSLGDLWEKNIIGGRP